MSTYTVDGLSAILCRGENLSEVILVEPSGNVDERYLVGCHAIDVAGNVWLYASCGSYLVLPDGETAYAAPTHAGNFLSATDIDGSVIGVLERGIVYMDDVYRIHVEGDEPLFKAAHCSSDYCIAYGELPTYIPMPIIALVNRDGVGLVMLTTSSGMAASVKTSADSWSVSVSVNPVSGLVIIGRADNLEKIFVVAWRNKATTFATYGNRSLVVWSQGRAVMVNLETRVVEHRDANIADETIVDDSIFIVGEEAMIGEKRQPVANIATVDVGSYTSVVRDLKLEKVGRIEKIGVKKGGYAGGPGSSLTAVVVSY